MEKPERKYRVLVVEDTASFREAVAAMLRSVGFDVTAATNPEEARDLLQKGSFHLALLDNQMPPKAGEDLQDDAGLELAEFVKKNYPYTDSVIVTTLGDIEFVKRAIREDIVKGYFNKGDIAKGRVPDILTLLKEVLRKREVFVREPSEYTHGVDPLDFWGVEGVVEKELQWRSTGTVRFALGVVHAAISPGCMSSKITTGRKVVGRIAKKGVVEVVPGESEH